MIIYVHSSPNIKPSCTHNMKDHSVHALLVTHYSHKKPWHSHAHFVVLLHIACMCSVLGNHELLTHHVHATRQKKLWPPGNWKLVSQRKITTVDMDRISDWIILTRRVSLALSYFAVANSCICLEKDCLQAEKWEISLLEKRQKGKPINFLYKLYCFLYCLNYYHYHYNCCCRYILLYITITNTTTIYEWTKIHLPSVS